MFTCTSWFAHESHSRSQWLEHLTVPRKEVLGKTLGLLDAAVRAPLSSWTAMVGWGDMKLSVRGGSKSVLTPKFHLLCISHDPCPMARVYKVLKPICSMELSWDCQKLGKCWVCSLFPVVIHACYLNIFYLIRLFIHPFEIYWIYEKRTSLNIESTKQIIRESSYSHNYIREKYIWFKKS